MAKVFTIEPNPHWVIIDNFSKLPNGAAIYTFRSKNPTEFKPAFQDSAGNVPYGQPIVGKGNGTFPPIFWEFDDTAPDESYYIQVYDAPITSNGVFLWDYNGLSGGNSGGGGGSTTTNNDIENLIINGEFYNHIDDVLGTPSMPTFVTLAPSNHAGIGGIAQSITDGPPSPDIIFFKNNQSDSDLLQFVPITPWGTNNLGINPTPEIFVRYQCSVAGAQTNKYIQFPVVKGLQNLSQQTVSVQIFARLVSGNPQGMRLTFRQFFGNGAPTSPDVIDLIGGGPVNLVLGSWVQIQINSHVIPSIVGKNQGTCKNDALFFQINFPTSATFEVEFILPAIYLGATNSNFDFHTIDQVNAITNSPRTGDIRMSLNNFNQYGWLAMRDGTIGNQGSLATERGAADTFQLYSLIWNTFKGANEAFAPMSGGAYGADPVTDFVANRTLTLTKTAGRMLAAVGTPSANVVPVPGGSNTGTNWVIGQMTGNERHTQSVAEMPVHNHPAEAWVQGVTAHTNINANINAVNGDKDATVIEVGNSGSGNPFNIQNPVSYLNVFIKL